MSFTLLVKMVHLLQKVKKELYSFIMDKQDVQTIYNILKQYPEIMPVIGGKEKIIQFLNNIFLLKKK